MPTAQNIKRLTIASTLSIGLVALAIACGDTTPTNSVDMTTTPPDMAMEPPADLTMETVIVPVVASVTPAFVPTAGNVLVTLNGSGFVQGATVKFGSQTVTTTTVGAGGTTLTFMAPANSGKGLIELTVTNPDQKSFTKTGATLVYLSSVTFGNMVALAATDKGPRGLAAADLEGDGDLDLAVAFGDANTVGTWVNDGTGKFAMKNKRGVGTYPFSVTVGEVNGDTFKDIITPNKSSNSVSVCLGAAAGDFAAPVNNTTMVGTSRSTAARAIGTWISSPAMLADQARLAVSPSTQYSMPPLRSPGPRATRTKSGRCDAQRFSKNEVPSTPSG